MGMFIAGLVLFLGTHSLNVFAPQLRKSLIERFGEGGFKGLYSVVSIVSFVLLIWGYGAARLSTPVLYTPPTGLRHFALLLMLPVFPLLLSAYMPGRIKAALKHPMLTAVKAWALAHLLSNGTLADGLLFASFLAWAVIVRISIKRRPAKPVPPLARGATPLMLDVAAVGIGIGLYVIFLFGLHQSLFGVAPIASLARPMP